LNFVPINEYFINASGRPAIFFSLVVSPWSTVTGGRALLPTNGGAQRLRPERGGGLW